jgi:hypothetical protein
MSPEFYAILGVGLSNIGLLSGLMIFLFNMLNRRIDRLEVRIDRLEDRMERIEGRIERLAEEVHSLDLRVSKLEWMLDAALYGKPVTFPPETEAPDGLSADKE